MRKVLSLSIIAALLLLNFNLLKSSFETSQKLSELGQEEAVVKNLQTKNNQLKNELSEHSSDYFVEQEARNRLGYGRAGETSIVVESSEIEKAAAEKVKEQKSNMQMWLDLVKF